MLQLLSTVFLNINRMGRKRQSSPPPAPEKKKAAKAAPRAKSKVAAPKSVASASLVNLFGAHAASSVVQTGAEREVQNFSVPACSAVPAVEKVEEETPALAPVLGVGHRPLPVRLLRRRRRLRSRQLLFRLKRCQPFLLMNPARIAAWNLHGQVFLPGQLGKSLQPLKACQGNLQLLLM